jgi:nucleotide-binding universal stress UspA family protein
MIKTIVVPTDGSEHANKAVEMAGEIAAKFDARVIILQALLHHTGTADLKQLCDDIGVDEEVKSKIENLENAMLEASAATYAPVPLPVPAEVLRKIGDRITEQAQQVLKDKGVTQIATQVIDGNPADNIIAAAEHENADLIVMGRRGLGDIAGLLMGSVSHKVSHVADCACLTVK